MPAVSKRQQAFFRAELGRARAGQRTKTGLSEKTLSEFASGPIKKRRKRK